MPEPWPLSPISLPLLPIRRTLKQKISPDLQKGTNSMLVRSQITPAHLPFVEDLNINSACWMFYNKKMSDFSPYFFQVYSHGGKQFGAKSGLGPDSKNFVYLTMHLKQLFM